MSAGIASLRRITLVAENTWREAARQKGHYSFVLVAVGLVAGARWLQDFNFGASELRFLTDCGFGAMAFLGAAFVIYASAQLFFSEIESRAILPLLARPVHRGEFVLGKLLAIAGLAAVFCGLVALVMAGVVAGREAELGAEAGRGVSTANAVNYTSLAIGAVLQWLRLTVLAAIAVLIATYARTQLFTVGATFLVFVICHLQHLVHGTYARAEAATTRIAAALGSWLFPNFQVFALVDSFAGPEAPPAGQVARVVIYACVYIVTASVLAVVSFNRREI